MATRVLGGTSEWASPRSAHRAYRRILVPLDGTLFAESALTPAAALATRAGATLDLVSVVPREETKLDLGDAVEMAQPGSLEFAERLEEYVLAVMARVEAEWGCDVVTGVLADASPAVGLKSYVDRKSVDVAVAATHSGDIASRAVLGRLSRELSREAPCPLLLIPASEGRQHDHHDPLHGPVLTVAAVLENGSEADLEVVRHAVRMARLWGAALCLLQVLPSDAEDRARPTTSTPARGMQCGDGPFGERLADLVDALGGGDLDVDSKVLEGSGVTAALVDFIGDRHVDLLVAGRLRKGTLDRLLRSQQPEGVAQRIRHAGVLICPVA